MSNAAATFDAVRALAARVDKDRTFLLSGLGGLLLVLTILSLTIGPAAVDLGDVVHGLGALFNFSSGDLAPGAAIVAGVRAPRTLLGLGVGAALGVSGAALQGIFRNPLVDPGLIGVSAGGALGASIWIVFGAAFAGAGFLAPSMLTLCAFSGSLAAMSVVYLIGRRFGGLSVAIILLAGIAVNAVTGAGLGLLQFATDDAQLRSIVFWQMGSLASANWCEILPAALMMLTAAVFLLREANELDLYTLGEKEALHLGCNVDRLKARIIVLAALAAGAAVAVSGIVAFVGLVAAHLIRLVAGAGHRAVLPGSALLGAALVLGSDLIARTIVAPAELPIGVVTSLIGAPIFLWLLIRKRSVAP